MNLGALEVRIRLNLRLFLVTFGTEAVSDSDALAAHPVVDAVGNLGREVGADDTNIHNGDAELLRLDVTPLRDVAHEGLAIIADDLNLVVGGDFFTYFGGDNCLKSAPGSEFGANHLKELTGVNDAVSGVGVDSEGLLLGGQELGWLRVEAKETFFDPVRGLNERRLKVEPGLRCLATIFAEAGDDDLFRLVNDVDALSKQNETGHGHEEEGESN